MAILFGLGVVLYVLVCIVLVFLVLIQSDNGGGISGAISGGLANASAMLGTQDTANILTRGTTIFAIAYMGICMLLSLGLSKGMIMGPQEKSLLKKRAESAQQNNFSPASALGGLQGLNPDQAAPAQDAGIPTLPGEAMPVAPAAPAAPAPAPAAK